METEKQNEIDVAVFDAMAALNKILKDAYLTHDQRAAFNTAVAELEDM